MDLGFMVPLVATAVFNSCAKSEMGIKAKQAMKKSLKKVNVTNKPAEGADFLPLACGPGRKFPELKLLENTSPVLYIGRIPHGFYEKEMEAYFAQFGTIKRMRIARNKKVKILNLFSTAAVFAYICIYYQYDDDLWFVMFTLSNQCGQIERERHDKERTSEEHNKLVDRVVMKRYKTRRKRIEAAGIDYECPKIVTSMLLQRR